MRAAQVDVAARVAADEVVQHHLAQHVGALLARRRHRHLQREGARAAHAHGVLRLRVHVDHVLGLQHARLQVGRADQTDLLVAGDEHLQRTVLQGLVLQHREAHGDAHAIITAERRAGGLQVLTVDTGNDGILQEVDDHVVILLADHIHVSLEANDRLILESYGSSWKHRSHPG